jgi:polyketide cyclase/dehydrase/lipid transport protein
MKVLLIVVGVLVLAIIAIVVTGAILPKRHTASRTAIIKATPEQVFALISGPQNWRTDLKEYKFFDEGDRHMQRETDKHGQTITYEIVELRPPMLRKTTIADKGLPFGGSWTWNVQPHSDGCAVTVTEDGEVYNPIFRFVSRFIMGHTRTIDNYLAMLAQAANPQRAQ